MGTKLVKIGEEIYAKIKEFAEKRQTTIRDVVERAISLYIQGVEIGKIDKEIKGITDKDIIVQYKARCFLCGKPIMPGEVAHYLKITYTDNSSRSFIAHLSCWTEKYDTSLAKAIIKRERVKMEIKALEKYRKQLVEEITTKYEEIRNLLAKLRNKVEEIHGFPEYYEIVRELSIIRDQLEDIRLLLSEDVKEIKKLKKEVELKHNH